MQLAVAKDHERLKLLREVAGTRVYDEKKEQSKAILKESGMVYRKITILFHYLFTYTLVEKIEMKALF